VFTAYSCCPDKAAGWPELKFSTGIRRAMPEYQFIGAISFLQLARDTRLAKIRTFYADFHSCNHADGKLI